MLGMSKEEIMKGLLEYKKRILVKEFNFLNKILEMKKWSIDFVDQIKIKKVDENLLAMTGFYEESFFPYSGNYESLTEKKYFSVDINEGIFEIPFSGSYDAQYVHRIYNAETVGEELLKVGINPAFIILVERNYSSSGSIEGDSFFGITIFKATSFDIVEHHAQQFHKAAQALEAELRAAEK